MVELPKGIGPLQGLISGTRVTDFSDNRRNEDAKGSSPPRDEVNLSREAISLSQAEQASADVRGALEKDTDLTLGSGQNFDESL